MRDHFKCEKTMNLKGTLNRELNNQLDFLVTNMKGIQRLLLITIWRAMHTYVANLKTIFAHLLR